MLLNDTATERFDIGRAAIFRYAPEYAGTGQTTAGAWDGTTDLFAEMEHIGTTEGPVDIGANPEYSELSIEVTGPAALKRYLSGERPEFEIGVFPNPANMGVFTPTGRGSAGQKRRRLVREHTLWVVPEELFLETDAAGNMTEVAVTYAGGSFLKDGNALSVAEQELVDMSILIWRADFSRLTPLYQHDDGGKSLKNVTVTVQQDLQKPDGCQLYLVMSELADFPTLDLAGSES